MSGILIVEDAAVVREPIEAALRSKGYETCSVQNGNEALAVLAKRVPDLVLLDIAMPVMDGITLLRRIREDARTSGVPVIMLTALSDKQKVVEAVKLGISGYMLKSKFGLDTLLAQVAEHVRPGGQEERPAGGESAAAQEKAECATGGAQAGSPAGPEEGASSAGAGSAAPVATAAPGPGVVKRLGTEDPVALLKSLKPIVTRSQISERIEELDQLRAFSPMVSQLIKITGDPECSIERVVKAISQDQAIALKILKLANSAVYTRGEPVESVRKAVLRIGLDNIRQAVLNIGVVDRFSGGDCARRLNMGLFWEHAIACGIIAAEIAHLTECIDPDTAFTMGLLHDVGRVVYTELLGDVYPDVVRAAAETELPLEQVESRMLLLNHGDIMDRVLLTWKFSKALVDPIAFHHLSVGNIRKVATKQVNEIAVLALANRLAHAMLLGSSGNEVIYPTEEFCELLKLDGEVVSKIEGMAPQQTRDMKFAMIAQGDQSQWTCAADAHHSAIGAPFRAIFVSEALDIDAYRIFCSALAGPEQPELPNVAVAHISHVREREGVSVKLAGAEKKAGVGPLPAIVISPTGKLSLMEDVTGGRNVFLLQSPVPVTRFVRAMRSALGVEEQIRAAA